MDSFSGDCCQILDWDSGFFGFPIGRARTDLQPQMLPGLMKECEEKRVRCLYLLADPGNPEMLAALEYHGFGLKDVRLTLRHPDPVSGGARGSGVRPAGPADLDALRRIARLSHHDSRFYFDSGFPRERCDDLYDVWISKSCCNGYADAVLVTEFEGRASSYVTCSMVGARRGQIGLLAVAPETRGTGVGRQLIQAALAWFGQRGAEDAITVTQGRNVAAVRAYERTGFVMESLQFWYHRWFSSAMHE